VKDENNEPMKAAFRSWLSFHCYPLEAPDVFLTRAVRPFLNQYIWPTKGARAFFIRFADERGPHIRLRLHGEATWLEATLRPALTGWFAGRGELIEIPYAPEAARFGGAAGMALTEAHFHLSTRVTLDRLAQVPHTYGTTLFDALRMHLLIALAAGMKREKAAWYFGQLYQQWLPAFFRPIDGQPLDETAQTAVLTYFRNGLESQQAALRPAFDELWTAASVGQFDTSQPEWQRWVRGNELILKELGDNLDKVLPSLIHLTNNRLGVNNQDEVFLCYMLANTL